MNNENLFKDFYNDITLPQRDTIWQSVWFQNDQDGHDSARKTSRACKFADSWQGKDSAKCLSSKRGSSLALLSAWSITAFTISGAGFIFSPCSASGFKCKLQVPSPDAKDSRWGSKRYDNILVL